MMERRFMSTGSLLSSLFRDFDDDDFRVSVSVE